MACCQYIEPKRFQPMKKILKMAEILDISESTIREIRGQYKSRLASAYKYIKEDGKNKPS